MFVGKEKFWWSLPFCQPLSLPRYLYCWGSFFPWTALKSGLLDQKHSSIELCPTWEGMKNWNLRMASYKVQLQMVNSHKSSCLWQNVFLSRHVPAKGVPLWFLVIWKQSHAHFDDGVTTFLKGESSLHLNHLHRYLLCPCRRRFHCHRCLAVCHPPCHPLSPSIPIPSTPTPPSKASTPTWQCCSSRSASARRYVFVGWGGKLRGHGHYCWWRLAGSRSLNIAQDRNRFSLLPQSGEGGSFGKACGHYFWWHRTW